MPMPDIKLLGPDEWQSLREIRLAALLESPHSFLSTYAIEKEFDEARWRAELSRGEWNIGFVDRTPVSLIGITRELYTPLWQCYLEYFWVHSGYRRRGIGLGMLRAILQRLKSIGVQTVYLWVLDGNDSAIRLYKRVGFVSTNYRQSLDGRPGLYEERMQLDLGLCSGLDRLRRRS